MNPHTFHALLFFVLASRWPSLRSCSYSSAVSISLSPPLVHLLVDGQDIVLAAPASFCQPPLLTEFPEPLLHFLVYFILMYLPTSASIINPVCVEDMLE